MQDAPDQAPPKPASVTGTCQVAGNERDQLFTVNLDTLTCDCPHGEPWHLPAKGKTWKPHNLCNHKLKAIASLCAAKPKDNELRDYYDTQLGKRYNVYEAVSAFHKELRLGDANKALYWATMILPHRGKHGVVKYMTQILHEETRDLNLGRYLMRLTTHGTDVSILDMQRAVTRFCAAPKKWELPWRYELFLDEQRGYKKLATKYTYAVAGHREIIDARHTSEFRKALLEGFKTGDRATVQYGLKGWFKTKSPDHDHMKIDMLNKLIEVMGGEQPNAFKHDEEYTRQLYEFIIRKTKLVGGVRYHELNALCDALTGEMGNDPVATLPALRHKTLLGYPKVRRVKLGGFKKIPLYAHDNHTWGGKAKLRQHRNQIEPGAVQRDLDFRLCGAYMGVAWRLLAHRQHGTIDCNWSKARWEPNWLWSHLDGMFY